MKKNKPLHRKNKDAEEVFCRFYYTGGAELFLVSASREHYCNTSQVLIFRRMSLWHETLSISRGPNDNMSTLSLIPVNNENIILAKLHVNVLMLSLKWTDGCTSVTAVDVHVGTDTKMPQCSTTLQAAGLDHGEISRISQTAIRQWEVLPH